MIHILFFSLVLLFSSPVFSTELFVTDVLSCDGNSQEAKALSLRKRIGEKLKSTDKDRKSGTVELKTQNFTKNMRTAANLKETKKDTLNMSLKELAKKANGRGIPFYSGIEFSVDGNNMYVWQVVSDFKNGPYSRLTKEPNYTVFTEYRMREDYLKDLSKGKWIIDVNLRDDIRDKPLFKDPSKKDGLNAVSTFDGVVMTYNEPSEVISPEEAIARMLESAALTCGAKDPFAEDSKSNSKVTR